LIEAIGISKSYSKKTVLSDINFSAKACESVVIVGRNGAGKSTLLSILAGYLKPDKGYIFTNKDKVAFCPQTDVLFEELTVADNILFWSKANSGSKDIQSSSSNLYELFEVAAYSGKRVSQLSGGMKKCVAITAALTNDANILILDEPFAGLDIFYKDILLSAFHALKSRGKTIIYTSHNTDEIMGLDSNIYALSEGKLAVVDTIAKDSNYEQIRRSLLEYSRS